MARIPRLHVSGGFYHVTLRGNHRQPIFFRPADYELLGQIVAEATEAECARVHAYCWMTNHLHLLLQVSDVPLGRIMLRVAARYARTVQMRLSTTGHLFERRYHATLIDVDRYLLTVLRYIHMNPVEAGLVRSPSAYHHSSHLDYLGHRHCPWIRTEFAMKLLSEDPQDARKRYAALMSEAAVKLYGLEIAPHPDHPQILGDDAFASRVIGSRWQPRIRKSLDDLVRECEWRFGVTQELLASATKAPCVSIARAWLAHEAVNGRIATVSVVARRLNRSESSIRELMLRRPRGTNRI